MKFSIKILIVVFSVFFSNSCLTNNINEGIILIYGIGEVTFIPNNVNLRITIKNIDTNLQNASNKTKNTIDNFLNICNAYSIINENIHTSNISTGREYKYSSETRENEFIGYYSNVTMLIMVDDFSKFEEFSGLLLQFDDISINNFQFSHSDIVKYESEADLLALSNAKLTAEKIAEHMGLRLGKIIDISYTIERDPFTGAWYYDSGPTGRSTGGIPVSPGIITISRRVQVKFRIN